MTAPTPIDPPSPLDPEDRSRLRQMVSQLLADAKTRRFNHDMEVETTQLTLTQIKTGKFSPGGDIKEQVERQNGVAVANRQQADNQIAVYERRLKELDA